VAATTVTNVLEGLRYTESPVQLMRAFNEESVAWDLLGNSGKSFTRLGGRGMNLESIVTQFPERVQGITEGGSIPAAIAMDTAEAVFSAHPVVGVWETTWSAIMRAQRSKDAFQRTIAMHQEMIRIAFVQDMSFELLDNGLGRRAILSAATNSTTQDALTALPRVRQGMVLDCMDTDWDTKHADSVSVSAVDLSVPQFTVSGAPSGTAAGDAWVTEDTTDDSLNDALHLNGLLGIVSNANPPSIVGNYGGINRSTAGNEFFEAPVLANSGTNRAMTSDLLLQALHTRRDVGGDATDKGQSKIAYLMRPALERRYIELFDAVRIVDTGKGAFDGDVGPKAGTTAKGRSNFTFAGMPIHTDVFAPANTVFCLDLPTFQIGYVDSKVPRAIDEIFAGQVPSLRQTSNATFEKVWYWEGELVCYEPRRNVRIDDVAES